MTCALAITNGTDVVIAADRLGSNGWTGTEYRNPKVFAVGNVLLGVAGSYRYSQLIQRKLKAPRDGFIDLDEDFVDAVRRVLKDHGSLKDGTTGNAEAAGVAVIGWKGRIFYFQSDLSMIEPDEPFVSVGSGDHHATGFLYSFDWSTPVAIDEMKRRASLAIECAARFVPSVRGKAQVEVLNGSAS
jgi:ATP-dependent protease HslVU (ClpYQ) peptidase subunit